MVDREGKSQAKAREGKDGSETPLCLFQYVDPNQSDHF